METSEVVVAEGPAAPVAVPPWQGRVIILDTSATTPFCSSGLSSKLYGGWRGLMAVSPACIEESIRRVSRLEELFAGETVVVLPQVVREMRAHLACINMHIDWFLRERERRGTIEKVGRRGYARRMDRLTEMLGRMRTWSDSFFRLVRLAERPEHGLGFCDGEAADLCRIESILSAAEAASCEISGAPERQADPLTWRGKMLVDFDAYCRRLQRAVGRSGDDRSTARRRAEKLRQPNSQGLLWHTDRHIVAAACAIGAVRPACVLSNDFGLGGVLARVLEGDERAVSFIRADRALA